MESKLNQFADIVMGQSPKGEDCNPSGIGLPLLNGPTEFGEHHPVPVQYTTDPRKIAQAGDILFCVRGSTTGKMNLADQKYAIGRGLAAIRHKQMPELQPFVRAVVEYGLGGLLAKATGSTFPNVSFGLIANLWWPPISENEQRSIAQFLGSLDDKIELNRQMNRTLEEMARAIFKSWFVDFDPVRAKAEGRDPGLPPEIADLFPDGFDDSPLGVIPRNWRACLISDLCSNIFSGGTPSTMEKAYWDGNIPWLSSGETRSKFVIDTEKSITHFGAENSSTRFARAGTTVIASAGQGHTRGQTSMLLLDTYINQSVVALQANPSLISDLYLFFDLERRYEEFRRVSDSQSSRGSLTTKLLGGLQIIQPPFSLATQFDKFIAPLIDKVNIHLHQARTLSQMRDTLLPLLVSGELRVCEVQEDIKVEVE